MKKFFSEFFTRGLIAAGFGPVVLAIIYAILGATGAVSSFSPREVCMGILSITLLALTVGGMTAIYQQEQLPLISAILIHGGVLYALYIIIYLLNGWLKRQLLPIVIFSVVFLVGYALIWGVIYCCTRANADKINRKIVCRQSSADAT